MKVWIAMALVGTMLLAAETAMAQTTAPAGESASAAAGEKGMEVGKGLAIFGATIGASLAVIGGAIGIGRIGGSIMDAIARQPEASGALFLPMIITAALIEGVTLFAIVVSMLVVLK